MTDKKPLPICKPENMGIKSSHIVNFINRLKSYRLNMHSYLIIKNGCIISEGYWQPFYEGKLHRMYSVSKTFTSAAIGLLIDEGKISIDDKVIDYFKDKLPENVHPYTAEMTIRDLLIMATPYTSPTYGLQYKDWAWTFFNTAPSHPAGTIFAYDTSGSFILDVIVERVTGKPFLDYMREKMLDELGFSADTWCVKSPEGYSWGGSGVMCTTRDLAKFALLFLQEGQWNGKQLLSKEYIKAAVSRQIDNKTDGWGDEATGGFGYGYQIWRTRNDSYSFIGMGDQLAICVPEHELVFVCTADNQGYSSSRNLIYNSLWDEIIDKIDKNENNSEEETDYNNLIKLNTSLKALPVPGSPDSPVQDKINNKIYKLNQSHSRMEYAKLSFSENGGVWSYKNESGECTIDFGIGCYKYGIFPNKNYFGDTIGVPRNSGYEYMASGAWTEENKFVLRVFIIDDYFGNMTVSFSFKEEEIAIYMSKTAEWFLDEYQGFSAGKVM